MHKNHTNKPQVLEILGLVKVKNKKKKSVPATINKSSKSIFICSLEKKIIVFLKEIFRDSMDH